MYVMCAKITFPDAGDTSLVMRNISSIHIESNIKSLTKTAEITIPRAVRKLFDIYKVSEVFRKGDRVVIELGYDNIFVEEFRGYISEGIGASMPIKIKCQDEMWKLKQLQVNYVSRSVSLAKLLSDLCKGYKIDAEQGVDLGAVRFAKTTVSAVLEKLSKDFGIYTFIDGDTIVSGKPYSRYTSVSPVTFNLERTVASNDLNYKNKEDVFVRVIVESTLLNGRKVKSDLGEDGGDRITQRYSRISSLTELKRKAKEIYDIAKLGGFDGTITAFGIPRVQIGWKAKLVSNLYPDRNGTYYIDSVVKDWSNKGYRQKIKIGGLVQRG